MRLSLQKRVYLSVGLLCLGYFFLYLLPNRREAFPSPNISDERPPKISINSAYESVYSSDIAFSAVWKARQKKVVDATINSFKGYTAVAWGKDELLPVTGQGNDWMKLGLTIVDSLDTLWWMSLENAEAKAEFERAQQWITKHWSMQSDADANVFETTIRVLGGFLSTYYFTKNAIFLSHAKNLADTLLVAFTSNSYSPIPHEYVNLRAKTIGKVSGDQRCIAEIGSIQMEFKYLSHLTGNKTYDQLADKVIDHISEKWPETSLPVTFMNLKTGEWDGEEVSYGARGDSFFEYLYKLHHQSGFKEEKYVKLWQKSWTAAKDWLIDVTPNENWVYIGTWNRGVPDYAKKQLKPNTAYDRAQQRKLQANPSTHKTRNGLSPSMDHLACYLPGTILLSVTKGVPLPIILKERNLTPEEQEDVEIATGLLKTCYRMYTVHQSRLALETIQFVTEGRQGLENDILLGYDRRNLLRPEFVESLFYFYRLTGNVTYREWGWDIWENGFEKNSRMVMRLKGQEHVVYSGIIDVTTSPLQRIDKMETFWIASGETLKYFYFLFYEPGDVNIRFPLDKASGTIGLVVTF